MRSVPQEKYTVEYYKTSCDGYNSDGSLCERLAALVKYIPDGSLAIADIGCGRGELAKHLSGLGHDVFSVDYSYGAFWMFECNCGDKLPFLRHDVSRGIPWIKDDFFDVVILADIIEHLYTEQLAILAKDVIRILRSGGTLLIDTPIMDGNESELHVDIKNSVEEVAWYFPGMKIKNLHWHKEPEHCNIIMVKE
jgi:SAM-dependent methyltransferase